LLTTVFRSALVVAIYIASGAVEEKFVTPGFSQSRDRELGDDAKSGQKRKVVVLAEITHGPDSPIVIFGHRQTLKQGKYSLETIPNAL
jgi:hypothetical protein